MSIYQTYFETLLLKNFNELASRVWVPPWGYKTFLAPQTKQQILQISCGCKVSASKTVATSTTTVI